MPLLVSLYYAIDNILMLQIAGFKIIADSTFAFLFVTLHWIRLVCLIEEIQIRERHRGRLATAAEGISTIISH